MKKALLSVSDKSGIVEFAKSLVDLGFELLSTGGTYKLLRESGVLVQEVSDFTGSAELFDGRVKTLHPKIHGAILHKRDDEKHLQEARDNDISSIDLLCVNLYPFENTTKRTDEFDLRRWQLPFVLRCRASRLPRPPQKYL